MPSSTTTSAENRTYAAAHFTIELDGVKEIGMFRSVEGGSMKADVMTYQNGGTYDHWRQLGKPKFDDVKMTFGMAMSEPFYDWISEFFAGNPVRKNGTIIAADFYYRERARRQFSNAMIKELTFPKLDATDKNSAYMTVAVAVEDMKFLKPDTEKIHEIKGDQVQMEWKACNFKLSLDGFSCCSRVTKVESFTVKQNVIEYHMGGRRSPTLTPSTIDYPQLSFSLPEADALPLLKHFMKRGVDGEVPGRFNGTIETYDNAKANKFFMHFQNADIVNVTPDKADASTDEVKQVKVDLYIESMDFQYLAGSLVSEM